MNPNFEHIYIITSHRSEVFGALSIFLFLVAHSTYYLTLIDSIIHFYCNNIEVINKLQRITENNKEFESLIKTSDHDAIN